MSTEYQSLENRLDRIEKTLEKIASGIDQGPSMVGLATDSVDEWLNESREEGIDVPARLRSGYELLLRLSEPSTNQTIHKLLDTVEQAPGLISMAADSADDHIRILNEGPVGISERMDTLLRLIDELTKPAMASRIEDLLEISDQLPGLIAMGVDSVDQFMSVHGQDISDALSFLDQENLLFLKNAGDAFTRAQEQPTEKMGLFGLMRALRDPDRQQAIGFLMNVLKNLGKTL